jgi:hypothetical protein
MTRKMAGFALGSRAKRALKPDNVSSFLRRLAVEMGSFQAVATLTRRGALPHGAAHERFPRHLHHLRDY